MARPSKLTEDQCARIRTLRYEGVSGPQLAKRFKVSESSLYKILNGSYAAAPSDASSLPPMAENVNMGATPSRFYEMTQQDQQAASRVRNAADAGDLAIDEVTLAAAELIVARARYIQALSRKR